MVILVGVTLSGCGTGGLAVKKDIWDAQDGFEQRQAGLSEKVLKIDGRLTALEEEIMVVSHQLEGLSQRVGSLESEFGRGLESVRDGQQQMGIELEGRIRSVDSGRQSDRDDMLGRMGIVLEEVTRENRLLREELEAIKSSLNVGVEHVVRRGDSIARIASQYGTTVEAIVKANNLADPDRISVGQKLFIPQ
jgi:nucleoid-associated protein YgaU